MGDDVRKIVDESIVKVLTGKAKRIDHELSDYKISVYRVGEMVRCDISPVK